MVKPQPDQDAPLPLGPAGAKKLDRDYGAQTGGRLTTAGGVRLPDTDHSLKAGERGPTLLEDFHLREKITHFDHERIPERVVHARGRRRSRCVRGQRCGTPDLTRAGFLQDGAQDRRSSPGSRRSSGHGARLTPPATCAASPSSSTPTRASSTSSATTCRCSSSRTAIKFPDLIHAVKPEPDREIPQAQSAHDTFWDFASPAHRVDPHVDVGDVRPRDPALVPHHGGLRGPHVPARQQPTTRRRWSSSTGSRQPACTGLVWEEAQIARQVSTRTSIVATWHDAIEAGSLPEWELGVQVLPGHRRPDLRGHRPAGPHQDRPRGARAGAGRRDA